MRHPKLFDIPPSAPSKAAKIKAFKERHGIWTHNASHLPVEDERWSAMLIATARKRMAGYGATPTTPGEEMIASYCRLLDEMNLLVTGKGEISAIRTLCERNDIPCPL